MKNLFKKISAILMAAIMVLAMASTAFADGPSAQITVNNLDDAATISYLQIIKPDQTTETGWAFTDGVSAKFKEANAKTGWSQLTDQQILWKLIKYADDNKDPKEAKATNIPEGTIAATATEIQNAMAKVETDLAESSYASTNVKGNVITVTSAGVYAIKATTTDTDNYAYSPMAAFVSFGSYNTSTGVPSALTNATVNAKRTTIKIEKDADEKDGVVEIGRDVTYTVKTNVPYIADNVTDVRYTITDTIEGAEYKVGTDGKLEVSVKIGAADPTISNVEIKTNADGKKYFVLDLSSVAANRNNANAAVVIEYKATVTSEKVENTVEPNDGKHTFTPETNTLYTGKITMTKTDDTKETLVALANAGFVIYREETTEVEGKETKKTHYAIVKKDDKANNEYVVTGWTESLDTAKVDNNLIITGKNGEAVVRGLDDSYTYNFKEIKAPEGYSVNTTDSVATWGTNQTAANRTGTATMSDTKLNSLPSTGGMGTYLFTIIGVVVMAGAAGAFFISRRKGSEE